MDDGFQVLLQIKTKLSALAGILPGFGLALSPPLKRLLWVMGGGSLGAASRYGVGLLTARLWGTDFPWGTLAVNLVGCFLIGLLIALSERVRLLTPEVRLLLITGYLGALTTFSSFALETVNAGRAGLMLQPLANILINNIGGLALTYLGLWLGGQR